MSLTISSLPPGEIPCTTSSTPLTISECLNRPNASWDSTNSKCHCCATDGNYYTNSATPTAPCTSCKNKPCGDPKFCKGTLVNSNAICEEDLKTKEWKTVCRNNATCGGECNGACGSREWYAFSQCNLVDGVYTCTTSFSQWKSWLTYLLILLFLIILGVIIYYWAKNAAKNLTTSVAYTTLPNGEVKSYALENTDIVSVK